MTAQQVTMHPIWAQFQRCLSNCVNTLIQQGQMSPQECPVVQQMLAQIGPGTMNFINSLLMRYQQIDDNAMNAEIMNNFLPSVRQAAQQRLAMSGGMGGGGFGMGGGYGTPMMPGRPMPYGYMAPNTPMVTPVTKPDPFSASPAAKFSGPGSLAQMKPEPPKPVQPKAAPFVSPKIVEDKTSTVCGCVTVKMAKFDLGGDRTARRLAVFDPRIRYTCDAEAINAYKSIFDIYKKTDQKILTVAYKQLKLIKWNRDEFLKMSQAVAAEVLKCGDNLEKKLKAITLALQNFPFGCMQEYTRLLLDEFDAHVKAGEFCDSSHPTNILGRMDSVQALCDMVCGDIDKNMLAALRSMNGFEERLRLIVSRIVDNFVVAMPKIILDPYKNRTLLDDYSRIMPQVWSADAGVTWNGTDDLFDLYLASRETIEGSRTDSAIRADSDLTVRLHELHSQFAAMYVYRMATWCDYPKSVSINYKNNGDCIPYVSELSKVNNELAFFCAEVLAAVADSSTAALLRFSPKNLYCSCDEETFAFQYGLTTDNSLWLGSCEFWKE